MSTLKSNMGKFIFATVTKAKRYILGVFSLVVLIGLFTFITPNLTKPAYADVILTASVNGSIVTFGFSPNANSALALVVYNSSNVSVADSGVLGDVPSWTWDSSAQPTGTYHAQVFAYGTTPFSNVVTFTAGGGGGGATWNNPGPPPPPFNIMDVFQPAKRFGSFGQLASDILLILVSLAGALALIFIIISGFKFVTSSGDEKKLASAKATLTYAIIGIAVVILAFVIVQVLQYFLQSSIQIT